MAASRISETYGLGAGAEWAARHGLIMGRDPDTMAQGQVLASLAAAR